MKSKFLVFLVFFTIVFAGFSQEQGFETADKFFQKVVDSYSQIDDYEADVILESSSSKLSGKLSYKYPDGFRLDFDYPDEQVWILSNNQLILHFPRQVTFVQPLQEGEDAGDGNGIGFASRDGLKTLQKGYKFSYLVSYSPMPLDEIDTTIMVYKLKGEWKSIDEGFKSLEISVMQHSDGSFLIRRISGINRNSAQYQIDFTNYKLNINIPRSRFDDYEIPSDSGHQQSIF